MGKISVKHYFNDRLKAESINGEKYRPLYVQIIRKLRTSQIRSAFVTEKITAEQLHTEKIQALCKQEATMIHAFFEFADKATDEFIVSKSKVSIIEVTGTRKINSLRAHEIIVNKINKIKNITFN